MALFQTVNDGFGLPTIELQRFESADDLLLIFSQDLQGATDAEALKRVCHPTAF